MTTAPMYAPFQYMQHGQPPHQPPQQFIQPDLGDIAPPDHVPGVQVTGATPTKLRSHHPSSNLPNSSPLEVSIEPYPNVMAIAPKLASSSSNAPSANPPKSTMGPRQRTAEDEEARKARKREMGRERQRRKRLRDKEKREAARAQLSGDVYQQFAGRAAGDRSSFTSTSSFEGISSSASFSNIPPLSMGFSPSQSFVSSTSTASLSDVSSPGASLSPTMAGFASDTSWNEHTAVFSNLSLSGDGTVRASKHRGQPTHAFNQGQSMSRHASDNDDYGYTSDLQRTNSKRRKSDAGGDGPVGLGVTVDDDWSNTARRPRQSRRTASVPDGAIFDLHNSDGPPALPPNFHQNVVRVPPSSTASPEGIFFATSVVAAVSASEWSALLQSRLGLTGELLERMGNDLAITYDRWRVEQRLNPVTLDQETRMSLQSSSPPVPTSPSSASFATPSQRHHEVMQQQPSPPTSSRGAPVAPGTPQSQSKAGASSSNASPTNPTLQTPSQQQGGFPQPPFSGDPSWQSTPVYGSDWRNQFAQQGKEQYGNPNVVIPSHNAGMSGPDFSAPRGPFNQNARGVPATTPLYYNPQFPQPPVAGMRHDGQAFQGFNQ